MSDPPRSYVVAPAAERDMESILSWTQERFGTQGRLRYEALLAQAIVDVVADPDRVGSHWRPEIAPASRTYHRWHSRERVTPTRNRVQRPRHFLLYRIAGDGRVEIGRVLHERMDLDAHLPEDYGSGTPGGKSSQ